MARSRARVTEVPDHDEIVAWYRKRLTRKVERPEPEWKPVTLGPTWRTTEDGTWFLPELTIGWDVLGWCGAWMQHRPGKPWRFTDEQARLILWWFAVEDDGDWLFHDGVIQRLKGWGKDPLGATLLATEAFGPCRVAPVDDWDDEGPVALDNPNGWAQTAAVAQEQTKNTMRLFPGLFTRAAKRRFRLQITQHAVHGLGGTRMIEAVTSSPATLEGNRGSFVLKNETHHWGSHNNGHEMAAAIERNATKSEGGDARALAITNAFEPGADSQAERDRDAFELQGTASFTTGILYDSVEAPPEAPLTAAAAPGVIRSIRGDSTWLSPKRLVKSITDPRNPPSRSRRWWYNQITATEDAWITPQQWDACADVDHEVEPGTIITLGFDGSISDDHSALIGCDVEADHLFAIGVWEPNEATGKIDRAAINRAVRKAFATYDVVGFYSDLYPWESYVDAWAEDLADKLCTKASPRQPIAWDMRSRKKEFTVAAERLHAAIEASWEEAVAAAEENREPGARLTHCGARKVRRHFVNARRHVNEWGVSVRKEHRESPKKIDSVPAAALARLARSDYLALPKSRRRRKRSGAANFH